MKYLWRKPLLPLLVILFLQIGAGSAALLATGADRDAKTVEKLYESLQIYMDVLVQDGSSTGLCLPLAEVQALSSQPGILRADAEAPASAAAENSTLAIKVVFSANPEELVPLRERATCNNPQACFSNERSAGRVPCLLSKTVQKALGLSAEDQFEFELAFSGSDGSVLTLPCVLASVADSLPETADCVAGLFAMPEELLPQLAADSVRLAVDPAENREIDALKARILSVLNESANGSYGIFCNDRALKKAVRPLEERTVLQRRCAGWLGALFAAASAALCGFWTQSRSKEILILRLLGQTPARIFRDLCAHFFLLAGLGGAFALLWCGVFFRGIGVRAAGLFLCAAIGISFPPTALLLWSFVRKNLIVLYQAKEG